MAYGSATWNQSIVAKNYKYTGFDENGFLHGSNSTKNLESILKSYNNAIRNINSVNANNTQQEDVLASAKAINDANNEKYMQYFNMANEFNSAEAQKNRDWQKEMSDTAHQREVVDLKKAGLNPVLSANAGASVGSGSSASSVQGQVDTSSLASIIQSYMNNATTLKVAKLNNSTQMAINNASLLNAKDIAKLNAQANMYGAELGAAASRYGSELGYKGKIDTSMFGQLIDAIKGFTGSDKPGRSLGEIVGDQVGRLTNPDNWKTYKKTGDKHGTSKGSKK